MDRLPLIQTPEDAGAALDRLAALSPQDEEFHALMEALGQWQPSDPLSDDVQALERRLEDLRDRHKDGFGKDVRGEAA